MIARNLGAQGGETFTKRHSKGETSNMTEYGKGKTEKNKGGKKENCQEDQTTC